MKGSPRKRGGEGGFSLLEVMFAITALVVAVLGMTASATTFATLRRANEETQVAYAAARQQLDLVRGATFNTISATYDNSDFIVDADGDGAEDLRPQTGDADGKCGKITVTNAGPAGNTSSLLNVTIAISWQGVLGNRSYKIATYVANRS